MMAMIRKFEEEQLEQLDGEEAEAKEDAMMALLQRLDEGADLETVLGQMSVEDKNDFFQMIKDPEKVQALLARDTFVPWWEDETGGPVDTDGCVLRSSLSLPKLPRVVDQSVLYGILDLVLSYSVTIRAFALDRHESTPSRLEEACQFLLSLSSFDNKIRLKSLVEVIDALKLALSQQSSRALDSNALTQIAVDGTSLMKPAIAQSKVNFSSTDYYTVHVKLLAVLDHISKIIRLWATSTGERKKLQLKVAFFASYLIKRVERRQLLEVVDELEILIPSQATG